MAHIANLSPEIILEIMKLLDLHEICTVIRTSPLFLRHFVTHRNRLLDSTVRDLKEFFGHEWSMCLSALRIRYTQPTSTPSTDLEIREAEQATIRLCRHRGLNLELSTTTALSLLCNARQLLVEAEWIVKSYALQAWHSMQDFIGEPRTEALVVSYNERRQFIQAAIHFETYCRIFFLHEKILFKRNTTFRQGFFRFSRKYGVGEGRFYSIVYYIFDQYLAAITSTCSHLSTRIPSTKDQSRQRNLWQRQTRFEALNFAHFLTSQGLGLLYKLQCMDRPAQTDFMLEWFYKVSQAQDPLVLMVRGIDLHDKGTVETRPWQPWEGIEYKLFGVLAPWRCANLFWERDRIEPLRRELFISSN